MLGAQQINTITIRTNNVQGANDQNNSAASLLRIFFLLIQLLQVGAAGWGDDGIVKISYCIIGRFD